MEPIQHTASASRDRRTAQDEAEIIHLIGIGGIVDCPELDSKESDPLRIDSVETRWEDYYFAAHAQFWIKVCLGHHAGERDRAGVPGRHDRVESWGSRNGVSFDRPETLRRSIIEHR